MNSKTYCRGLEINQKIGYMKGSMKGRITDKMEIVSMRGRMTDKMEISKYKFNEGESFKSQETLISNKNLKKTWKLIDEFSQTTILISGIKY